MSKKRNVEILFFDIMAQVFNKYGRNVLNKSEQIGGKEGEQGWQKMCAVFESKHGDAS